MKFADYTKSEGIVNKEGDQNIIEKELDDLEAWNNRNGMKFNNAGHELKD